MDCEKKYKDALERARKIHNQTGFDYEKGLIEEIFPELRESEDERIRKAIKYCIKQGFIGRGSIENVIVDDCLSWLEKQGEQKPIISDDALREGIAHFGITQYQIDNWLRKYVGVEKLEQKPADKVEPNFKVGDWCIDEEDGTIFQIVKVLNNTYTYRTNEGDEYSCTHYSLENDARHWTILDAKDGDVLYSLDSNRPFIYKERNGYEQATAYCGLNIYGKFFVWNTKDCIITTDKYIPATKEERELLFSRMKEAGYEWDAKDKELKKIDQTPIWSNTDLISLGYLAYFVDKNGDKFYGKNKPNVVKWIHSLANCTTPQQEWSEEDKRNLDWLITVCERIHYKSDPQLPPKSALILRDWLKFLKDRVQPKQEWSEKDEVGFDDAIWAIEQARTIAKDENDMGNLWYAEHWLKSLKDKYTWKPSKEQM